MTVTNNHTRERTAGWVRAASGPQFASVSFAKGAGEYHIGPTATLPGQDDIGHFLGRNPEHAELADGESLYIVGEGLLVITAETPLVG